MSLKCTKIIGSFAAVFLLCFLAETSLCYNFTKDVSSNLILEQSAECKKKMTSVCISGSGKSAVSQVRIIEEKTICSDRLGGISKDDMNILCRIVQAEAGGEDQLGKKMVADVIINRVLSSAFPNAVGEVVFQQEQGQSQFSPVSDGRYQEVAVTPETMEAVKEAVTSNDRTNGALYFAAEKSITEEKKEWFHNSLTCLGTHGGHTFYK